MIRPTVTCQTCGLPLGFWLSTQQVADQLGVRARSVARLIANGEIPATRFGPRLWRIRHKDFHAYLAARASLEVD